MQIIDGPTVDGLMDWPMVVAALRAGHLRPRPQVGDYYFSGDGNGLLSRTAWITGLGACVKAATVFPGNANRKPPLATVQGSVLLLDPENGTTRALIDGAALTRWKTAGDSALGSALLSRPNSRVLTMVGAGNMAEPLIRAHLSVRPSLERAIIWNRSRPRAEALAARLADLGRTIEIASSLEAAVRGADVISAATMSQQPLIKGAWLKPGTHLDLVGAYTPQMREADDDAMRVSRVFVDFRETTIHHIGELMIPLGNGTIAETDVVDDLYGLVPGNNGRLSNNDITLFKNGGGAHLDLMTALAIAGSAAAARV